MIEYNRTELTTDVLVIGGGIAAVFAATRAIKKGAKVTLVDKGSIGRSGQTPFASAMGIFDKNEGDDRDNWHRMMAENAYNLNNPAYLDLFMDYSKEVYDELVTWKATDIGFGAVFRQQVIDAGVEVIERTMITNLLEEGGTVAGAVGFKLDTNEAVVLHATSVIMCTGGGGFKPNGFQVCSLTFDGDAMAYRIGAKISGKEFVDTHGTLEEAPAYCWGQWQGMWSQGLPKLTNPLIDGGGNALDLSSYIAKHEGSSIEMPARDMPESQEGSEMSGPPNGNSEGGEMSGPPDGNSEGSEKPAGGGMRSMIGGASAGLSVHKAEGLFPSDNKCGTNIKGLYAAGDCLSSMLVGPIYNGVSGFSMTGSGTQGLVAGEVAAKYIKNNEIANITESKIEETLSEMFEPLNNEQGYDPAWVEHMLRGTLIPYYVLYIKHEERLNSALTNIEFFKDHFAVKLKADDLHDLRKAHEVKNMILNAEMKLRSSLYRTESRGNHYREDYPDSNDSNWLAWVVIEKGSDGNMELDKFMIEDFEKLVIS